MVNQKYASKQLSRRLFSATKRATDMYRRGENPYASLDRMAMQGARRAGGAFLARAAGRVVRKYMAPKRVRSTVVKRKRYVTTGKYGGKFPKARKTKINLYATKGVYSTSETTGTVADPDCVFVTHVAVDGYQAISIAGEALIRKLLEKANFTIANVDDILISDFINSSEAWQIELTRINGIDGSESIWEVHTLAAGSTVRTIADTFRDKWLSWSAGFNNTGAGDANISQNPYRYVLYRRDAGTASLRFFEAEIRFEEEIMCMEGKSVLKIQNRCLSASGSGDSEDVSNNPLIGRRYKFSELPKVRDKLAYPFMSVPVNNGVQLVRAATITGIGSNTAYKEPPLPGQFTNCKGSSGIRLGPGEIKTGSIYFKKSMPFLKYLAWIRLQYSVTPLFLAYTQSFPSELFALEDIINVNASQNISVAYEANRTVGVYFKTIKKGRAVTQFQNYVYNNLPL